MVGSLSTRYQPGGSVLYGLQVTEQFVRDAKKQCFTIIQATDNKPGLMSWWDRLTNTGPQATNITVGSSRCWKLMQHARPETAGCQ